MSDSSPPCLLVVEDQLLIAMLLEDQLEMLGHGVVQASRLAAGLTLAQEAAIDAAILDVNLAGEMSFPIAEVLHLRGIPFAFSSGYGDGALPEPWCGHLMLPKPYDRGQLLAVLDVLLKQTDTTAA